MNSSPRTCKGKTFLFQFSIHPLILDQGYLQLPRRQGHWGKGGGGGWKSSEVEKGQLPLYSPQSVRPARSSSCADFVCSLIDTPLACRRAMVNLECDSTRAEMEPLTSSNQHKCRPQITAAAETAGLEALPPGSTGSFAGCPNPIASCDLATLDRVDGQRGESLATAACS